MNRVFLCCVLIACGCDGEWKPTGDGKTVVHTRTGEIRVTSTAESVEKYNVRRKAEAAVRAAESEKNQLRLEAERLTENQARARLRTQTKIAVAKEHRATALNNGHHYHAVQILVCNMPMSEVQEIHGSWWIDTKPFRLDQFPTKAERDKLLNLVEHAISGGGHISRENWSAIYDHLRSLEFDDRGRAEMLRTAKQLAESAEALKSAADREVESLQILERRFANEKAAGQKAFDEDQARQKQSQEKWLMLKAALSKEEVTAILGLPKHTSVREWTWVYSIMIIPDPDYTVEEDGKVVFDPSGRVTDWVAPTWHFQKR